MDWNSFDERQLLLAYASLMEEFRTRGLIRTANNPLADYTESLVANALGLTLTANSAAGHDAVDQTGIRYQIKGRRLTSPNGSTQLSAIRNLDNHPFDFLAAVVFNSTFELQYASLIPIEVVKEKCRFSKHTNSSILLFKRTLLVDPRVTDITSKLMT